MHAPLTSLTEGFLAIVDPTNKWFRPCVDVLVFCQVLLECKLLTTDLAREVLDDLVGFHMSFQTPLRSEYAFALGNIASELEFLLTFCHVCHTYFVKK